MFFHSTFRPIKKHYTRILHWKSLENFIFVTTVFPNLENLSFVTTVFWNLDIGIKIEFLDLEANFETT